MLSKRRSATALGSLGIYLAALLASGLHHHHHAEHDARADPGAAYTAHSSDDTPVDSCAADPGSCPVCALALQAQAPAPAFVLCFTALQVDTLTHGNEPLPLLAASGPGKARAPPSR